MFFTKKLAHLSQKEAVLPVLSKASTLHSLQRAGFPVYALSFSESLTGSYVFKIGNNKLLIKETNSNHMQSKE
jgi:hypothetical protein